MEHIAAKLAQQALAFIYEQINQGIDIDGNRYKYSDKPFSLPYRKNIIAKFGKRQEGSLYQIFTGSNGRKSILILGGYRVYKEKMAKSMDFLTWSGEMLAAMTVIEPNKDTAKIVFNNKEALIKAYYLNVLGVGKSRKLWKFFGLTKENTQKLNELAKEYADVMITEDFKWR